MSMKILAIETATEACSVALILFEGKSKHQFVSRFELAPREHTKLLLPMMDEVLEEADLELNQLDAIAFSSGPGAFTGLRIAAGVAQGAALSADKLLIPVSTLSALALQAHQRYKQNEFILAALDARMGEIYWGIFQVKSGELNLIDEERVSKPEEVFEVALKYNSVIAIGTGWDAYKEDFSKFDKENKITLIEGQYPHAEAIAELAVSLYENNKAVLPEDAQPTYIRNNVAEKSRTSVS